MDHKPLANRMCPLNLDEYEGQEHILGKDKLLYRMVMADRISSIILYGPPGTGKTTIARIISNMTKVPFEQVNAVTSGVKELKQIIEDAKNPLLNPKLRKILFIDEIHRFNKMQQDVLLPYVENGTLILIGATTENPYFEVNKALISRSTVFMLKPLLEENIVRILKRAIENSEKGLGYLEINIKEEMLRIIASYSNGDARIALNTLELAAISTAPDKNGIINVDKEVIENCIQKKSYIFDKNGEAHYDTISAFIKSMRGSDPNATIYYLARMLEAGEDPVFIARRIMICASEDVGLANSSALRTSVSCANAIRMIGMPEARILLAHCALEVALSPKSNSAYVAINDALRYVKNNPQHSIPMHLRNAPVEDMKDLGYSIDYKYPHSYTNGYIDQDYLPEEMEGISFYNDKKVGYEQKLNTYLMKIKKENNIDEK